MVVKHNANDVKLILLMFALGGMLPFVAFFLFSLNQYS